jgi:AcrR family transcriptional regulator
MDRRERRTREAIFDAFTELLREKAYNRITVQEIIDAADIGRATFYAHFETKDYLIKALCEELFNHIIDTAMGHSHAHDRYACDKPTDSVFLHLIYHLKENDRNILALLTSQSNEIFLQYFKTNLKKLIRSQFAEAGKLRGVGLPEDYLVDYISSSFVETVSWWLRHGTKESPERLAGYFHTVMTPVL